MNKGKAVRKICEALNADMAGLGVKTANGDDYRIDQSMLISAIMASELELETEFRNKKFKVSPQDILDIIGYYTEIFGGDAEYAKESVDAAVIFKTSGFVSDGPGYFGDVFVLVHSGGPECVETLIRDMDSQKIERCPTTYEDEQPTEEDKK